MLILKNSLSTDDGFLDVGWMSEKMDLSEFDLDSLIGSYSSEESPSSPNSLLTSFDSPMEMNLESLDTNIPALHDSRELGLFVPSIHSLPLECPAPRAAEAKKTEETLHQEVILKSEPPSPVPSPPSPVFTLELASDIDLPETKKVAASLAATIIPDPSSIQTTSPIVLSVPSSAHFVMVLTNKNEPPLVSLPDQSIKSSPPSSDSESDSGIESIGSSPIHLHSPPPDSSPSAGSSRTKPYSKQEPKVASSPAVKTLKVKSTSGAPRVVEKKLKKMEQNKTAATRYRQKKRFEQELLSTELQGLEKRNRELTEKADSINREIQYLKDLMEEVRKHRRGKTSPVVQ